MKIEDVMSKDLIVGYIPGTVADALQILSVNNVSGIPILKKNTNKIVGVVTREDIFKNPEEDQLAMIVNENYSYISKDKDIREAAKIFYEKKIHGLPVIDTHKNLVGIISPLEILNIIVKEEISDIARDHFSNFVVPVYLETPIDIIMEIINITNQCALPVLDDSRKVVGIVTDGDIFKLSEIKEGIKQSNIGMGDDEDQWTWEGIRDTVRLYQSISEVSLPDIPVKEVMINDLKTATRSTPVCDIAKIMIKYKFGNVPIVNEQNYLKGMISDIDLMKCMFD
jgi:CBS domain-containing protein